MRTQLRPFRFVWAALAGLLVSHSARAQEPDPATLRTESPYFVIEGGEPGVDRLPLQATHVDFQVVGVIADVTVTQVYTNGGSRPIHARYVFPASIHAAVHGMRMRIGDQRIEAVVQEKKQAEATFEAARREGKSASLLEQQRPNVFSMRVAHVMPGDRIEVELRYSELLVPSEGIYELVYPTVVGPRYASPLAPTDAGQDGRVSSAYTGEAEQPHYRFTLEGRIESGVPLQELSVPSHQVTERRERADRVHVTLAAAESHGGDRDFILRYRLAGGQVQSGLLLHDGRSAPAGEGTDEGFFLLTVQPPARVTPELLPPREYVFVLDVSGSMHGFPLDTARLLMRRLARGLRPRDRFNVILFSGDSRVLWPRSRPASEANLAEAIGVIDDERGGGGTELLSALQSALALPAASGCARSFVVVTDGFISAERDVFDHIRSHIDQASVFAFGIGSSVNRYLVDGIARAGLGEAFVVTEPGEADATAERFRRYIEAPVLTDVKLTSDGFQIYDVQPGVIPDVLAERPVVVTGKWRGQPTGRLRITGTGGAGRFEQSVDVAATHPDPRNAVLGRLWARSRIAEVSDFSFGADTAEEQALVTALGLRYNLLTRYTSFVAVSRRVRNPGADAQDVDQPLPLPLGVSELALGEPLYGAPEPELWLLLGLFALALFLGTVRGAGMKGRAS